MDYLSIGSFQVELAVGGTAQAVEKPAAKPGEDNPQIGSVVVRAMKGNTGIIYLGGEKGKLGSGENTATAAEGFELAAGDAISLDIQGLGRAWMNGTHAGDKVCVCWTGP